MTHGRRVERVSALIRREMSDLLLKGVRDHRVNQGILSITEVEVSGDLQHCKIFVSIFGNEIKTDEVISGLNSASAFLRGELGRRLQMRRAPSLLFQLDHGIEKGASVLNLLTRLQDEKNNRGETSPPNEQGL